MKFGEDIGYGLEKSWLTFGRLQLAVNDTMAEVCAECRCLVLLLLRGSLCVKCPQIADKLFSSFGQDILDSLFWTAAEPRGRRREHVGVLPHLALAVVYVCILQCHCLQCSELIPLPSNGHQLSYDDCLDDKMENCQNCSVLRCVWQLYTMLWAVLKMSVGLGFVSCALHLAFCVLA